MRRQQPRNLSKRKKALVFLLLSQTSIKFRLVCQDSHPFTSIENAGIICQRKSQIYSKGVNFSREFSETRKTLIYLFMLVQLVKLVRGQSPHVQAGWVVRVVQAQPRCGGVRRQPGGTGALQGPGQVVRAPAGVSVRHRRRSCHRHKSLHRGQHSKCISAGEFSNKAVVKVLTPNKTDFCSENQHHFALRSVD